MKSMMNDLKRRFHLQNTGPWRPSLVAGLVLACLTAGIPAAVQGGFDRPARTLVLDPGHGGLDRGGRGPAGALEKDITLQMALDIAETCGRRYRVVLTRSGDYGLPLFDRTAVANQEHADLFISLHTGGAFSGSAGGMNVFYAAAPGTPQTAGPGDEPLGWDHLQDRHLQASRQLAEHVHRQLAEQVPAAAAGPREAPLAVLLGADMPSVLVEPETLTHPSGERVLADHGSRAAIAQAICDAVDAFFDP